MKDLKTAVLIFAYSAEYEATIKPFRQSQEVFESLNSRTLQQVKKSKLPYYIVTEKEQVGNSFGEKYINAIQSIYNLGYKSLIIIGNDTPQLTAKHLLTANSKLAQNKTVIGSSYDGGFYLLGLKRENFNLNSFLQLPWQCQNLCNSLSALLAGNGASIYNLQKLIDIDNLEDVEKIINSYKKVYEHLFHLFLNIFQRIKIYFTNFCEIIPTLLLSTSYNKGSPNFI